jgi:hypothetical protein
MSVINWLKIKLAAFRGGISVKPHDRKKNHKKLRLVEDAQFYLWEVRNGKRKADSKIIGKHLEFLENVEKYWLDYIVGLNENDLWNVRMSVCEGLDDYYNYLNRTTVGRTSKEIEKGLNERERLRLV